MSKNSIQFQLLLSMLLIGIIYGLTFHYIVMPFMRNQLLHCILMGLLFGIFNFFIAHMFFEKFATLKETNKFLHDELKTDKLTGLLNRACFDKNITEINNATPTRL
ncbi:MAG: hypothetical protein JG764_1138 [Clostridiales bacterium]|jgi:diguanylate cyclase|nr:hypothetical protein [Clostridiales bacterium]